MLRPDEGRVSRDVWCREAVAGCRDPAPVAPRDVHVQTARPELHRRARVVEPGSRIRQIVGGDGDDRREQRRVAVAGDVVGRADQERVGEVGPVREVMEGIYRKFDQNGARDNDSAMLALLESGLQMVEPNAAEVAQWRGIVSRSHRQLAGEGVFDLALLERLQRLLDDYRQGKIVMVP